MGHSFKRVISILLAAVLLALCAPAAFAASESEALQFNNDGSFKIMQIADCQDDEKPNWKMIAYLNAAIQQEQPDLIIFTGDNIRGAKCKDINDVRSAIDAILLPVMRAQIPFAVVFGNHDNEGGVSNAAQLEIYQSYANCLAADTPGLTGTGNYNLPIYAHDSASVAFNLWLFDSGNDSDNSYFTGAQEDSRILWYRQQSELLQAENGGVAVPSMVFQHIIFPGIKERYFKYSAIPRVRIDRDIVLDTKDLPPAVTAGQLDAFLECGDVLAAVFGHYHMTDSTAWFNDLCIVQSPGASFSAYGHAEVRGVRVITLNEDDTGTFDTKVVKFKDLRQDYDGIALSAGEKIAQFFRALWDAIKTWTKLGR